LLVVTMSVGALSIGATDVLSVIFAEDRLEAGGGTVAGYLMAAVGAGAVLGSLVVNRFLAGGRLSMPFLVAAAAVSAPFAALAGIERLGSALVAFAVVGLGDSILRITGAVAIQRTAPRSLLVRMFGINEALRMAGMAAGALVVPLVVRSVGLQDALVIVSAGILVLAGGLVLVLRRKLSDVRPPPPELVDRLLIDQLFADLDVLMLEALAGTCERRSIEPGTHLVAQGEMGTNYFLLEAGCVDVVIDGKRVRRMGPGESFGEIALVRNMPRTATVTAVDRVDVLTIERTPFLEAVTGRPRTLEAAQEVVDRWLGGDGVG
jgi:MFS family permease